MGQKIESTNFDDEAYISFKHLLEADTARCQDWIKQGKFSHYKPQFGMEIEFLMLDHDFQPAHKNVAFIETIRDDAYNTEVGTCALEINTPYYDASPSLLKTMQNDLSKLWDKAIETGKKLEVIPFCIGSQPIGTLHEYDNDKITPEHRYYALEKQLAGLRHNKAIRFNINGPVNKLEIETNSIALMGATSAFHMHIRLPIEKTHHFYNLACIIAAPITAIGANSAFLLDQQLWDETRIPLFERLVNAGNKFPQSDSPRVFFNERYIDNSLLGVFQDNLKYPIVIPECHSEESNTLWHMRLHNGTLWRWIRPVIGFDENNEPHFRVELRVLPGGTSIIDMVANIAFFIGLMHGLVDDPLVQECKLPFDKVSENFYTAARHGLASNVFWLEGKQVPLRQLIAETLVPAAEKGLQSLGVDEDDIKLYLSVIKERAISGKTGSQWQREFFANHDHDFHKLIKAYIKNQANDMPVHTWNV